MRSHGLVELPVGYGGPDTVCCAEKAQAEGTTIRLVGSNISCIDCGNCSNSTPP